MSVHGNFRTEMPVGGTTMTYRHNERFPMELFRPHERQALRNHGQSLERLSERGGLSWCEALAILEGRDWQKVSDAEERFRALASAMSAGTAETQSGSGLQPASAVPQGDAQ
jgi:hypothetical protein